MELLFHPERDSQYLHFENADRYPFKPLATGFSRVNAWWLADAALLAYWSEKKIREVYSELQLESVFLQNGSTQCYVASNAQFVVLGFRGTQSDERQDLLDDGRCAQEEWALGGRVHCGFKQALDRVWGDLQGVLGELNDGRRTFWFTGHSLGAALATLAADLFAVKSSPAHVYAFGSPRVGNSDFADGFNLRFKGRAFRFVNHTDVVTHVPPPLLLVPPVQYQHIELRKYIDVNGNISDDCPSIPYFVRELIGDKRHLLEVMDALCHGQLTVLPGFLINHTPRRYAVLLWNDFDAHEVTI